RYTLRLQLRYTLRLQLRYIIFHEFIIRLLIFLMEDKYLIDLHLLPKTSSVIKHSSVRRLMYRRSNEDRCVP
ncbi:hypothetical protein P5G89_26405, partial [Serratia nevei]|nr:hypothetical protein [Serratia nevei]